MPAAPATPGLPAPSLRERLSRLERTLAGAAALATFAALTQWILWLQREPPSADNFVGPPRSDYALSDFSLAAYRADGSFAFEVVAPRMTRHPWLGTFDVEKPRFRFVDGGGRAWNAHAAEGWVSKDAKEVRLVRDVHAERPATPDLDPLTIDGASLHALVEADRVSSDDAVTLRSPGSILRGTGLDADLRTGRFVLRSQVTGRYDPKLDALP